MLRVVVFGTSGAGKTTFAHALAARLQVPHVELDAINWQPDWHGLDRHDPDEFVRRVKDEIGAAAWVVDGNYGVVRDLVWRRATHLVWLDYSRCVIMARVIRRSMLRAIFRTELWAGNREQWRRLLRPSHPIRWAWSTWKRRRAETEERLSRPDYAHLALIRLTRPAESRRTIELLVGVHVE